MAEIETKKKKTRKRKRSINVKVEILKQKPETSLPLIGYFPSGFDPQSKTRTVSNSDEDEEEEEIETRVRVFKSKLENHANRFQLVVSPSGTKVEFVGTSYSGEAATPKLCTYSLGVLDKATNLLRIVPIASDKIFRLEPRIAGKEHIEEEDGDLTADGKAQKKAQIIEQLTNQYGTKTSINRRKKAESLDEKENPDAKKDLEIKIKGIEINKEALQSTSAYSARNIPPHNPTATTPEEAYPINKIILEGELSHLLDIMEHVESGEELSPNAYPSFISNRISWLQEIQDYYEKKKLACILSFMNHLIKFKEQKSMDKSAPAKHHKIPSILAKRFRTVFVEDSQKIELSGEKRNLLISYVLVLTLLADNFSTDITDIARDLKMSNVSLRDHYKNLGCKLSREGKLMLVTLPVPLQFPKPKMSRRRE